MGAREHGSTGAQGGAGSSCSSGCVVLGLLGGIGSGKTTVARVLADRGAVVLDADAICSELHDTPEIRAAIEQRWGRAAVDENGELDRAGLAACVFDDPAQVAELDRLLHPKVIERIEREIERARRSGDAMLCVIDAPLLLESGLDRLCDATVFVECDEAERDRRLAGARGWTPDEARRREAHQRPLGRKRAAADFIVDNRGDRAALEEQVEKILAHFNPVGV